MGWRHVLLRATFACGFAGATFFCKYATYVDGDDDRITPVLTRVVENDEYIQYLANEITIPASQAKKIRERLGIVMPDPLPEYERWIDFDLLRQPDHRGESLFVITFLDDAV
ncbi:hypothetical protein AURDEDRAFT_164134 [Auricularia subglabra TFB-10046 SS5]|nr:hypothetical protein AURDEDRAFT_164134 [Auricularia subglabra TFB-10046 SS5]